MNDQSLTLEQLEFSEPYNKITACSFVEGVCRHPEMYTINGTLAEVGAFLEGFYSGMISHSQDKHRYSAEAYWWSDFCEWVTIQLFSKEKSWRDLFKWLCETYPEQSDGFQKLIELYKLYLQAHQPNEVFS